MGVDPRHAVWRSDLLAIDMLGMSLSVTFETSLGAEMITGQSVHLLQGDSGAGMSFVEQEIEVRTGIMAADEVDQDHLSVEQLYDTEAQVPDVENLMRMRLYQSRDETRGTYLMFR